MTHFTDNYTKSLCNSSNHFWNKGKLEKACNGLTLSFQQKQEAIDNV